MDLYCNNKQIKTEHDTLAYACFLAHIRHAAYNFVYIFPSCLRIRERERESENMRAESMETEGEIKHHMMGAVIAFETTRHIKTSPPFLTCFIASSSPPLDGIIRLFVRKEESGSWRSDNSSSQRADRPP